jgi:hypothetical protein
MHWRGVGMHKKWGNVTLWWDGGKGVASVMIVSPVDWDGDLVWNFFQGRT